MEGNVNEETRREERETATLLRSRSTTRGTSMMMRPTTLALVALALLLASATAEVSQKSSERGGQNKVDNKEDVFNPSPKELLSNLTSLSKAISAAEESPGNSMLLDAVKATIDAKNLSILVNNETVVFALSEFISNHSDDLKNYTIFRIFTAADFAPLRTKIEAMNKWVQDSNKRFRRFEKSLEASEKNLEKKMNESFTFIDDLKPLNFTALKFTELPAYNLTDLLEGDYDYGTNGTGAVDDVDFQVGFFNKKLNTKGSGVFDFDFHRPEKMDENSTWRGNTTRCKREKKACNSQCGGRNEVKLNTCKESKREGITVKCSCGSSEKMKTGGGSFFSFVSQVRTTPFGGGVDDDDGANDDDGTDDNGANDDGANDDDGGNDDGANDDDGGNDDGANGDSSEGEATAGLGGRHRPGPVFVLRNPWFHGSLVDWFNVPRPSLHLWSLGAAPVDSAASAASSAQVRFKEKKQNHSVVLTNGGVVSVVAALALAVVVAVVAAAVTGRRQHTTHTDVGERLCPQFGGSSLDGERLPLLHK